MTDDETSTAIEMILERVYSGIAGMETARLAAEEFMSTPLCVPDAEPGPVEPPRPLSELEEDDFYTFRGTVRKSGW
ncbi:hypothetical protein DE4585_04616 [Mycobacteroides salmoniphilum]|uniref:Uncharacterized protein n=1 Tax=Mycobacteroides salmoniphilum TaxID=404941 RepID=A0A4R8RZM6_9MYCO|nr:hypothetical protein [Mycobacteroides salmoniphilum]TDZ76772.1 hypothetical protein DE4586_04679 [Mycobacteroides salmoniphilum]TDZ78779.1 hypothetical protein DE4585_04616 [Mycobacteroides salmoniphilum]TDZ85290.1 hypothetical protein DE4587_04217 [Mycobacteroides salmoniphilum]